MKPRGGDRTLFRPVRAYVLHYSFTGVPLRSTTCLYSGYPFGVLPRMDNWYSPSSSFRPSALTHKLINALKKPPLGEVWRGLQLKTEII